ncbi:histidinol-phosphate transaminase [Candidatus Magnetominusculus xianensis]|uniref:histidinol-phosphate transaminase n=1 Tax=Candidatus Magnetominusculus xianensis TaxID=1748249 RepID=UPI001F01D046|nr:histidinol-phosphate transaminase [Candidatus Magnetominusculus xianensis]
MPQYVDNIAPYVPGKPIEELERELGISRSVKLASNENPLGPSPLAVDEIAKHVGTLHRYPDGGAYELRSALAQQHGVEIDEVIVGQGSNELIDIAIRAFQEPGDETIMGNPSFVVYYISSAKAGGTPVMVPLTTDYRLDLKAMAEKITGRTKIICIANPNNPTGTIVTKDEMREFFRALPDNILVIMDEAYYEYAASGNGGDGGGGFPDSMEHFRDGREILILRTFSKAYGLAGCRIGYGIAKSRITGAMNKIREPFNTSTLAQKAAIAALKDTEHIRRAVEINAEGRAYLYKELKALGIDFVPSHTNFIYMDLKKNAVEIYNRLLKLGMIVRPMGSADTTTIRVTIGLPPENEEFIRTLREVL